MDDKFTDSQRAKAKAIQDAQDEEDKRIMALEKKAPTTKTEMGERILPPLKGIKDGVEKFGDKAKEFGNKAKEFGGRVIDKILPEPTPVKKAKGGLVTRADGAAKRGKTKGRTV
jgi:hypothetical protein